jgi:DNA-binding transcriptional LysR family regulator
MVEKGLGIAILPESILNKMSYHIVKKNIYPPIVRTIGLAFKDKKTLPIASRYFIDFILKHLK